MSTIKQADFGTLPSDELVHLFTLKNDNGLEISVTNFGGRIVMLKTPDRNGHIDDIVLGFDSLAPYTVKNPFFGALVGRYANRIANAKFTLDGNIYQLANNNGPNSLHGGIIGFDKVCWQPEIKDGSLVLTYLSRDGEEGYPGNLQTTVTYSLSNDNAFSIDYRATTDRHTVLNLTNHSYFNLAGHAHGPIVNHEVTIHADRFTPVNEHLIPTGELCAVEGTPFDFRNPHRVGDRIDADDQQIKLGPGYDHNFVLNGSGMRLAARASHPSSGRIMEVHTTQPGVQFYTGNHLPERLSGKNGAVYGFRCGMCFETQHFPDSPNQLQFPSTILSPSDDFHEQTIFKFAAG